MYQETTEYKLMRLASELKNAKAAEALARSGRIDAEEQIATLIPTKDTGQKTVTLDNGTKITVKRGLNYKADCQAIESEWEENDTPVPVKTKTTRELDVKGYEWYMANNAVIFARISKHVTVTPKKVAGTLVVK